MIWWYSKIFQLTNWNPQNRKQLYYSLLFGTYCPQFEFSHHYLAQNNVKLFYHRKNNDSTWNGIILTVFASLRWSCAFPLFSLSWLTLTCDSEFSHITWRLSVSLSCSGKSLVFTLSWLTCSEDSELLHTIIGETWSATSTYNYTTLPGHYLIKTNNFSSKPCSFNLKNNTKIQLFFILTIFFYLQFFINNFHNNDQLHLLLQHFGCKILSLCWLAMMICTFYWKSSLWSQFLLLNIFKILRKNFCFEFLVLHWILNIIVYPNFNKLASSKLKTPLLYVSPFFNLLMFLLQIFQLHLSPNIHIFKNKFIQSPFIWAIIFSLSIIKSLFSPN